MMRVAEIFTSIQGESTWAGLPCTFIRLTGCNLRCSYCDTTYAYEGGDDMSEDDILARISEAGTGLVEITGGEPLMNSHTPALARRLLDSGYQVLVETNGSMDISVLPEDVIAIVDMKTPGSGMSERNDLKNLSRLRPRDELKLVLTDRRDYEWARELMREHGLGRECPVLLSPVFGRLDPGVLAGWMLNDRLMARLNLQLHKYIFGPDAKGV